MCCVCERSDIERNCKIYLLSDSSTEQEGWWWRGHVLLAEDEKSSVPGRAEGIPEYTGIYTSPAMARDKYPESDIIIFLFVLCLRAGLE